MAIDLPCKERITTLSRSAYSYLLWWSPSQAPRRSRGMILPMMSAGNAAQLAADDRGVITDRGPLGSYPSSSRQLAHQLN
jgi:hypothetical protein